MIRENNYYSHDPNGTGIVSMYKDETVRNVIAAHVMGGVAIGRDYDPRLQRPPDNGEFAVPAPNPGTDGGNSEITVAIH